MVALSISADVLQHVLINFVLGVLAAKSAVVRSDLICKQMSIVHGVVVQRCPELEFFGS